MEPKEIQIAFFLVPPIFMGIVSPIKIKLIILKRVPRIKPLPNGLRPVKIRTSPAAIAVIIAAEQYFFWVCLIVSIILVRLFIFIFAGLRNLKNLPVGFEVKIPHELLLARYLPKEDKRRKEYEEKLKTVSKFRNVSRARDLDGVHVILDPGHGGRDPGAVGRWGMREDEYAYDIVCRIRRILLSETRAKVHITTRDRKTGYSVRNKKQLRPDANEVLLTTPKYANTNAKVSANLRCFLAASIYKSIPLSARNNNQVVFTSFHADSLYAALNGATIYVPDAYLSRRSLNRTGGIYDRTREVRACRPIKTTYSKRIRSEGYSRDFAKELIRGFKKHKVAVLSFNAIRDHVTRGRREYVPAVIRYNPVPTKLLLEVGNLQNRRDCRRLMNYTYREAIARAYVDALKRYYSRRNGQIAGSR